MLLAHRKLLRLLAPLTLCGTVLAITGMGSPHYPAQGSTQSTPNAPVLLPPEENDAHLLTVILVHLGEPSLLEAAKDASVRSFRVSFFSPVPVHEVAVRLVVNADGSGQITSAVSSGSKTGIKRTKNSVSPADVDKFLKLVEKVGFWSMTSIEGTEQKTDDSGRTRYYFDGAWWMVEGVQNGSFHYVFRRNPKPSLITEIGCYLAKDLAKSDDSEIPMAGCNSRH